MSSLLDHIGRLIASFLQRPAGDYEPFTPSDPQALRASIKPGDILLIEGRNHISGIIKYLTQSTWSHAALFVGSIASKETLAGEACDLGRVLINRASWLRFVECPLRSKSDPFTATPRNAAKGHNRKSG